VSEPPAEESKRGSIVKPPRFEFAAVPILLGAAAIIVAAIVLSAPEREAEAERRRAMVRSSQAVGLSAGAGFRGIQSVSMEDFRAGLLDGLGGGTSETRVMARPELFARIRDVMKRLSEAELAAVAARIDREQDS
jgi:hypothetical protein